MKVEVEVDCEDNMVCEILEEHLGYLASSFPIHKDDIKYNKKLRKAMVRVLMHFTAPQEHKAIKRRWLKD